MAEEEGPAGATSAAARDRFAPIADLTPSMRSDAALKKIHGALLKRIEENVDGVCRRLPGESLHDFRVAVRRTRTGLRQLKRVYPRDVARRFVTEFGWLSTLTSPARDLEVYLASVDEYREALGEPTIVALEPFLDFLRGSEDRERGLCADGLRSDRYTALLAAWTEFLGRTTSENEQPINASLPVSELAAKRIDRAYRRVLQRGTPLELTSPAADYHRLRLDFKKLRYLLEFFGGLFDPSEGEDAIGALRRTQDALGKINDLCVQADWLVRFRGAKIDAVRSLGSYIEDRQKAKREAFLDSFAAFLDDESEGAIERFMRGLAIAR